jgi:Ca2+-binding RTX toxin-like protein
MTQSKNVLTKLTMSGLLLMAACGGESATNKPRTYTFDATGFDGLDTQEMPLVSTACTFVAAVGTVPAYMQLTVDSNETLYVFKRATDGRVVANATTTGVATGPECATTTTTQIRIVGTGTQHKVFLDYANGNFSMGTSLTVDTALSIRLGGGSTVDTVTLRGTSNVENWNFGTTGAAATAQSAANLNFGTTTGLDKFVDITFGPGEASVMGVRPHDPLDVKVSTGAGNDIITGQNAGLAAVTTGFIIPLTIWGGDGDDNITSGAPLATTPTVLFNTLNGGIGNDTFVQLGKVADHIVGGADIDLVDYGSRTAALAITLNAGSTDDGESGEADSIDGTTENVTGGAGNDVISALAATGIVHVLKGGPSVGSAADVTPGNDTLTGADLADTLVGGAGDDILAGGTGDDTIQGGTGSDTIDYSDRGSGVVVTCSLAATCGVTATPESDVFNTPTVDIENIRGGDGADVLTGNAFDNIIWGGLGADTIRGGDGSDTIYGQAGVDDIDGEIGNDIIAGGNGADVLEGGADNDLVDATEETGTLKDTTVGCGAGNDVVLYDALDTGSGIDTGTTCETIL